ncbi:MAG: nucleotide sugar dehydrogenase [Nanoarchaeota archaeon]|nr:nucleotide sugar dehydrogenase [Nanoarchaeota archaeon]
MKKLINKIFKMKRKQKVAVIGMGYVGFPLACAIARSKKYEVYGIDIDEKKIEQIKRRISPVEDKQAQKDIKKVKINATTDLSTLKEMKYIIICVPTPIDHNKNPDLTPVKRATESIAKNLKKGQLIILESTVNPGVCEEVILPILEETGLKGGIDFELAHCPERINPGDANWNVYNIPRNIGGLTLEGTKKIGNFYRTFINAPIKVMSSLKTVESTKIIENTFRDINIAYVNELAKSFDKLGIDVMEVINGASNKPFAFMAHYPGCGVGGHCIPVDPYYLIDYAAKNGFNHNLLKVARKINNSMPMYTVDKLVKKLNDLDVPLKDAKIGVLGISYKANMGDIRESPSLEMISKLKKMGCDVFTYDPYCPEESNAELDEILNECVGVIIATNHKQFTKIKKWKNIRIIIDGRNCLSKTNIGKKVTFYDGIGRGIKDDLDSTGSNNIKDTKKIDGIIIAKPLTLLNKGMRYIKNEHH